MTKTARADFHWLIMEEEKVVKLTGKWNKGKGERG